MVPMRLTHFHKLPSMPGFPLPLSHAPIVPAMPGEYPPIVVAKCCMSKLVYTETSIVGENHDKNARNWLAALVSSREGSMLRPRAPDSLTAGIIRVEA